MSLLWRILCVRKGKEGGGEGRKGEGEKRGGRDGERGKSRGRRDEERLMKGGREEDGDEGDNDDELVLVMTGDDCRVRVKEFMLR